MEAAPADQYPEISHSGCQVPDALCDGPGGEFGQGSQQVGRIQVAGIALGLSLPHPPGMESFLPGRSRQGFSEEGVVEQSGKQVFGDGSFSCHPAIFVVFFSWMDLAYILVQKGVTGPGVCPGYLIGVFTGREESEIGDAPDIKQEPVF